MYIQVTLDYKVNLAQNYYFLLGGSHFVFVHGDHKITSSTL